jgi:hypothetical protein
LAISDAGRSAYRALNTIAWFWELPKFGDRQSQACAVVVFCMVTIVIVYFKPSPEIDRTISDWSFAALLGVVGITRRAALTNSRSAEQHDDIGA